MTEERAYAYYQWSVTDIERHFEVNTEEGLKEKKAFLRLQKYGQNAIENLQDRTALSIFWAQFSNFFVWILALAALVSFYVDGLFQSFLLVTIVVLNIFLGFYQEFKAEKALQSLKNSFKLKIKVVRDGRVQLIDSCDLTLGDVVVIEPGDRIPADLRVVESQSLRIDEAALTGESVPVGKNVDPLPVDTLLADRRNMLYGATSVVAGRGRGIVVAIGKNTEVGRIAGLVSKTEEKTPLEREIEYLSKILTVISVLFVLVIFFVGVYQGMETLPLLTFAIAVLVGAVPESLPTIITLALAIGVSRMAKKKALVRKLAVIEALGTTNIIATDKTGTLTENSLSVDTVALPDGNIIGLENWFGHYSKNIKNLFEKAILCSSLDYKNGGELVGDPVEVAICRKIQKDDTILSRISKYKRLMEIPFDSANKYMAVLVQNKLGRELVVKGAPETIISFCSMTEKQKKDSEALARDLSTRGFRVIAVASKTINGKAFSTVNHLKLIGLIGLLDEPSSGIKEAFAKTIAAGIRPLILTGDHPQTAKFIAEKIGFIVDEDEIITGEELSSMSASKLASSLKKVKIFARITPEDKINIVDKLENLGFTVTVTGDGVNDAPAIKRASVGIAMGLKGTDVAREAADIVLSDDQYITIISAIEYGRAVFDNIKNAIIFLISGNFSEILLVAFAFIANLPIPLLTLQILWINMVTDSFPALALAFEEPSDRVLHEDPRSEKKSALRRSIYYAATLGVFGFLVGLGIYSYGLYHSIEKARTLLFCYFVFLELIYCFSIRSRYRIWQSLKSFFANKYLNLALFFTIIIQIIIIQKPFGAAFGTVPLKAGDNLVLLVSVLVSFLAAEVIRALFDHKKS